MKMVTAAVILALVLWTAQAANVTFPQCGQQQIRGSRAGRVVGGSSAYRGQFPWMVSVQRRGRHFCGGVIIDRRHVLTAAHCLRGRSARQLTVVTGEHDRRRREGSERTYRVARIIQHSGYRYPSFQHDIAILRLADRISWNQYRQPICLPSSAPKQTESVTVTGWGYLDELKKGGRPSQVLQRASMPLLTASTCADWFSDAGKRVRVKKGQVCAGYKKGGKDSCQGDSGGPLVRRSGGTFTLVGLVSSGVGCARPGLPGIYTDVFHYRGWVLRNVR